MIEAEEDAPAAYLIQSGVPDAKSVETTLDTARREASSGADVVDSAGAMCLLPGLFPSPAAHRRDLRLRVERTDERR